MLNRLKLWVIEKGANHMLEKYATKIQGYKTHVVQVVAVVVGVAAFIWGPLDIGAIHIPHIEFKDLLEILQVGGGLSFLRMALKPKGGSNEPVK